jgi:hypothetical protein
MSHLDVRVLALSVALGVSAPSVLLAQDPAPPSVNQQRAIALFTEARRLQNQGRSAEACELFRRSAELLRGPGILLNLAQCFEREDDAIGALETYENALAAAEEHPNAAPQQREVWADEAHRGIRAQRRRVAELVIRAAPTPNLLLELDGTVQSPRSGALRLVPGSHRLRATAPGRTPFELDVDAEAGRTTTVEVPELPAAVTTVPSEPEPLARPRREDEAGPVLPWILIGVGSTAIAGGVVTGLMTAKRSQTLEDGCRGGVCPSASENPG